MTRTPVPRLIISAEIIQYSPARRQFNDTPKPFGKPRMNLARPKSHRLGGAPSPKNVEIIPARRAKIHRRGRARLGESAREEAHHGNPAAGIRRGTTPDLIARPELTARVGRMHAGGFCRAHPRLFRPLLFAPGACRRHREMKPRAAWAREYTCSRGLNGRPRAKIAGGFGPRGNS